MKPIIPLKNVTRDDLPIVGEKIYELSRLEASDFKIPDGFCVTSDVYMRHMSSFISSIRRIDHYTKRAHVLRAASELSESMKNIMLPPDIIAAIKVSIRELKPKQYVAVRPSVFYKDSGETVYTGKYRSFFNVDEDNAVETIIKCWRDLFAEEAVLYRRRMGIENEEVEIAILIQKIIEGPCIGKIYTALPQNNDNSAMLIQAGYARAHNLLFKEQYEEEYHVDKETFIIQKPQQELFNQLIDDDQIVKLARIGLDIQKTFGQARGVEWAIGKDGKIWLVQSSSIDGWYPAKVEVDPKLKKREEKLYMHLGGIFGNENVISEVGKSIVNGIFPTEIYYFGDRPYLDMQGFVSGTGLMGKMILELIEKYDYVTAEKLTAAVAWIAEEKRKKGKNKGNSKSKKLLGIRKATEFTMLDARLKYEIKNYNKVFETAVERAEAFLNDAEEKIAGADTHAKKIRKVKSILDTSYQEIFKELMMTLCSGLRSLMELREICDKQAVDPAFTSVILGGFWTGILSDMTDELACVFRSFEKMLQSEKGANIFNRDSQDNIFLYKNYEAAAASVRDVDDGAAAEALISFFQKFGFWTTDQMDITQDNWSEDPLIIFESIRENVLKQIEWRNTENAQEAADALRDLLGEKVDKLVQNFKATLPVGAVAQYVFVRLADMTAKAVMEAAGEMEKNGGTIYNRSDVIYLKLEEIAEALETNKSVANKIMQRKKESKKNRKLAAPRIMCADGVIPETLSQKEESMSQSVQWQYLNGKGTSPGQAEGTARVVKDMRRIRLIPGEILVVRSLNMGYTPLMLQAGGVIAEFGGELSPGNILCVAREIPAVVGIEGCLQTISSGDVIRIDGRNGTVVKLERV